MQDSRHPTPRYAAASPVAAGAPGAMLTPRLLRLDEVMARVPLKKPTIYRAIRDGKFPAPVKLLGARASAWDEAEIGAWIASRLAERTGK